MYCFSSNKSLLIHTPLVSCNLVFMHTINTHRKNLIPYKLLEIYVALRNQNPVLRYLEYFKYDGNEAHLLATNYQICFRLRVSKEQIAHHISVSLVVH